MNPRVHGLTPPQLARLFAYSLQSLPEDEALSILLHVMAEAPADFLDDVESADVEPDSSRPATDREREALGLAVTSIRAAIDAARESYAASQAADADHLAPLGAALLLAVTPRPRDEQRRLTLRHSNGSRFYIEAAADELHEVIL